MGRDETHDAACKWAFRKTFRRLPTPDELGDYKLALDERDRLGLNDALPIFYRLRSEADRGPAKARRRTAVTVVEPSASPAAPPPEPPEPEPPQPEPSVPASPPADPRYGEHVIAAAAEVNVSERTLIAAAERLSVRCRHGQCWLPGQRLACELRLKNVTRPRIAALPPLRASGPLP